MPHNDATALDAEELLHLALREAGNDDNDKAIAHLKRAVDLAPESAKAWYLLGALHAEIGLYDRAVEEMQKAIDLDPELPTASFQLGLLHVTAGRVDDAERAWAALDRLGDDEPLLLFKRGMLALVRDQYQACIDDLSRGIELNSFNPDLNNDMQRILDSARELLGSAAPAANDAEAGVDDGARDEDGTAPGRQSLLDAYRRSDFDADD